MRTILLIFVYMIAASYTHAEECPILIGTYTCVFKDDESSQASARTSKLHIEQALIDGVNQYQIYAEDQTTNKPTYLADNKEKLTFKDTYHTEWTKTYCADAKLKYIKRTERKLGGTLETLKSFKVTEIRNLSDTKILIMTNVRDDHGDSSYQMQCELL